MVAETPSGLTRHPGMPDSGEVIPGMAHFAGTGPAGKHCGDCGHRGYERQTAVPKWDEVARCYVYGWYRYQGCAKFKGLTGKAGPVISANNASCKYFEDKV